MLCAKQKSEIEQENSYARNHARKSYLKDVDLNRICNTNCRNIVSRITVWHARLLTLASVHLPWAYSK